MSISDSIKRLGIIFSIVFLIAAIHIVRLGSYLQGGLYNLYYSYFSDIILPFGCYFLLCASEFRLPVLQGVEPLFPQPEFVSRFTSAGGLPILSHWGFKFSLAFLLPAIAETCQYFGLPLLGSTFDPLDYLMYGIGALAAAALDSQVFPRLFGFWDRASAVNNSPRPGEPPWTHAS
jgi:hypothetical protein